jgi:hypothetical protein
LNQVPDLATSLFTVRHIPTLSVIYFISPEDNILFTVNEKTSTLTAQQIPPAPNGTTLPLLAKASTIPQTTPNSKFAAAEIIIPTPSQLFPNPLIYVSNRNVGQKLDDRGDTIAIFEYINGTGSDVGGASQCQSSPTKRAHSRDFYSTRQTSGQNGSCLNLAAQVFTGLQQIRSMNIGPVETGGDEFLIAGANVAGGVVMFRRVDGGRNLVEVVRNEEIANRTSFVFV